VGTFIVSVVIKVVFHVGLKWTFISMARVFPKQAEDEHSHDHVLDTIQGVVKPEAAALHHAFI
jgi:hypothetical protein